METKIDAVVVLREAHMQLLEQCSLVLSDVGWRCSPPITGLRNLQEKIATALAATHPHKRAENNNEGVE